MTKKAAIGIVGAGLVGSGWAVVFARAGHDVVVYDPSDEVSGKVRPWAETALTELAAVGLADDAVAALARITVVESLAKAVSGADYVQESVFERVDVKAQVCRQIGQLLKAGAVVGSSSSGIPASAFTEDVANRDRFLIAHPVNPPHLVPVVELVPAPWTDPEALTFARALMKDVGQVPVSLTREIEGFVLNRLQGALLNEAWALFEEGYATAADIDATVAHGLGLRWSFMGPFETIDLNAPGGVADYAARLSPLYHAIAQSRREPRPWSDELVSKVAAERRAALPEADLAERRAWRDGRLTRLSAFKAKERAE